MADALATPYKIARRVRRWYLTLFFWCMETSVCNAFILYRMNHERKPIATRGTALTHLQYRVKLVEQWFQQAEHYAAMERRAQESSMPAVPAPAVREKVYVYRVGRVPEETFSRGLHLPCQDEEGKRGRCCECGNTTPWWCAACDRQYCLVKDRNCFFDVHHANMKP